MSAFRISYDFLPMELTIKAALLMQHWLSGLSAVLLGLFNYLIFIYFFK